MNTVHYWTVYFIAVGTFVGNDGLGASSIDETWNFLLEEEQSEEERRCESYICILKASLAGVYGDQTDITAKPANIVSLDGEQTLLVKAEFNAQGSLADTDGEQHPMTPR